MKVGIILGSIREGRATERLAEWVVKTARQRQDLEVEYLDLREYPLPFFNEPISPKFNPNRNLSGVPKKWLDKLQDQDAYIVVTPEYNHSIPGVLKNAFDYLDWQVQKKPFAIVSHGGAGGARAAGHLKHIISEVRGMAISTNIAFTHRVSENFDDDGNLSKTITSQEHGPHVTIEHLLDELTWYSNALSAARSKA
ncbi:MAG TPA: NAD(P)H-dependent oxidoreductase [Candidatus Saccharimonadales bacterium]|nr:NAD(P)H-dependent oxidoreductase [Candidatus Saccharimonadales bacterium]